MKKAGTCMGCWQCAQCDASGALRALLSPKRSLSFTRATGERQPKARILLYYLNATLPPPPYNLFDTFASCQR